MALDYTKNLSRTRSFSLWCERRPLHMLCAEANLRTLGYLDRRSPLQFCFVHSEVINDFSTAPHLSYKAYALRIMYYGRCHISVYPCSDRLCNCALHSIQSSLGSDSACPLHQSRRSDACPRRIQFNYGCGNLDYANARALETENYEETKAANNLLFPPWRLVRLIHTIFAVITSNAKLQGMHLQHSTYDQDARCIVDPCWMCVT